MRRAFALGFIAGLFDRAGWKAARNIAMAWGPLNARQFDGFDIANDLPLSPLGLAGGLCGRFRLYRLEAFLSHRGAWDWRRMAAYDFAADLFRKDTDQ